MIEKTTTNRNYPKPDAKNFLQDDVTRIESALDAIDTDIHAIKQEQTNLAAVKADKTEVDALKTKVETPPPIPVLSAANLRVDGFTLSWSKVGGADHYCLDVASDSTFSSFVGDYNDKQITGTSHEIVGLSLNTVYYCRIRSVNSFGASESCGALPVTTAMATRTFYYSGSIETWTVPEGVDSITIEAWGAQGGNAGTYSGGRGAYLKGTFTVSPGDVYRVLAGQKGVDAVDGYGQSSGTGGGGSFVALFREPDHIAKLVAGGGGGAGTLSASNPISDGQDGQLTTAGGTESQNPGGVDGNGGTADAHNGYNGGTGGGGFWGDGINNSAGDPAYGTVNRPGKAFVNGGNGGTPGSLGRPGGFGGGGAAGWTGGGGGGYSGGGAGKCIAGSKPCGGGGGSFNNGGNPTNTAGVQTGNGKVVISW